MEVLSNLLLGLSAAFASGCLFRVIAVSLSYHLGSEDEKQQNKKRLKNAFLVFFISLLVGSGGGVVKALVLHYFG